MSRGKQKLEATIDSSKFRRKLNAAAKCDKTRENNESETGTCLLRNAEEVSDCFVSSTMLDIEGI